MKTNALLDAARAEIKLGGYAVAPATALKDFGLLPRVQEHKRSMSAQAYPLDRNDVREKIPKADYHVSRKVDGEFNVLIYADGDVVTLNPGGTVRMGLPFQAEAAQLLKAAKVRNAMLAGELYVHREDRRPRVHDVSTVARQPQSEKDLQSLRFAVFDVLTLDEEAPPLFADRWKRIEKLVGKGKLIHPVEAKTAANAAEIEKIFERWVDGEGAEGLVVRSDTAGTFKIKPRHTLDVAVIGFTESTGDREGMLHDLLVAVVRDDGSLHVLGHVGGGFDEDERRSFFSDLKDRVVDSEYAEVNRDHVAYQMVRPEWVVEISCLDLISQTTRGSTVNRMVLDYDDGASCYRVVRRMPLASVISPQFVRRREDKAVNPRDVRIDQVSDVVEVPLVDRDARQMTLPKSQVLRREVYTKELKGERMVRKFLMWKSNKETDSEEYPAYVVHYTDFSPSRKTPLSREVRVSSSPKQIEALWEELKTANVKKGWELHSATAAETTSADVKSDADLPTQPAKKAPKAAAAKTTKPTADAVTKSDAGSKTTKSKSASASKSKGPADAKAPAKKAPIKKTTGDGPKKKPKK